MAHRFGKGGLLVILVTIVAVSFGCVGDGGDGVDVMMPGSADMMMTVGPGGGLTRSPQAPVYAYTSLATLAALFSQAVRPSSHRCQQPSARDYGMDTAAQPDEGTAYVKSISSDGMGGFHVVSVF